MKLTDVLTATNMNPDYYKFIPIFIKTWKKLFPEINIHIIIIANEIIKELIPYKEHIKLFSPIKGVDTGFIAQNIRLLYPALLNANGGILITDMDMIPMSTKYYTELIKDFDKSNFICYRPLSCVGKDEMVICYNIAHSSIWSDIFDIKNINDIKSTIIYLNSLSNSKYRGERAEIDYKPGWTTDQLYLYEKTQEWNKKTNNLIILNNQIHLITAQEDPYITNTYYRLWLSFPRGIINIIKNDMMSDFHMPRPYNKYKNIIDKVISI